MPFHLRPTAPIAPEALLPGDPGRALALAQELLAKPRMSNHHRGLWGYWGETKAEGRPLTIQATGIGGPSSAVVLTELAELGVRRAVRIGTCTSLSPALELGAIGVVGEAKAGDGTTRALGGGGATAPDPTLSAALLAAAPGAREIRVETTDLFYGSPAPAADDDVDAREMAAAALFALAERLELEGACMLVVAARDEERLDDERLAAAELEMGRAAAAALAQPAAEPSSTSSLD